MNTRIHLSSLLAQRRAGILQRWTSAIAREHPDKELNRGELWDHLPVFFDEVLNALATEEGASAEGPAAGPTASAAHGTQRLRVGFDLTEVIREYEILTECILDEVEALDGSVSIRAFRRVQRLLNAGRTNAVSAYVERRDKEMTREHSQHVAFVAHELRTPLMTAITASTVLRKSAAPDQEHALTLLTRNLNALRELIDQMLLADPLGGALPVSPEPLDLRALLDEVVGDARVAAEQRQIEVTIEAPDVLAIDADRRLLRSCLSNLLGNAVKFTHEGGAIMVRAVRGEGRTMIEVEDRCGGLPEGNPAELFEPFVQRSENRSGFGLGLAIVRQAMEAHGGTVTVRNLPGRGCVFSLELPQSVPGQHPGQQG
jgi:signal transduction histidine kinase